MQDVSPLDFFALAWFLVFWAGYVRFSKNKYKNENVGLIAEMNAVRKDWGEEVIHRENRMMDIVLINGLVQKESFFASTTILLLASALALMGVGDQVLQLFQNIPFAQETPIILWEMKVLVLIMVLMFAFFKFTWSIRQSSYCATLVGSMPAPEHCETPAARAKAIQLANLSSLAASQFNNGLRAYYFSLAILSWFYHPLAFMLASAWVVAILYRREYFSNAHSILKENVDGAEDSDTSTDKET